MRVSLQVARLMHMLLSIVVVKQKSVLLAYRTVNGRLQIVHFGNGRSNYILVGTTFHANLTLELLLDEVC